MSIVGPRTVRGSFVPFHFWLSGPNRTAGNLLAAILEDT